MISARRETEIADEEIERSLKEENELVKELGTEGLVGDIAMRGPDRLDRYDLVISPQDQLMMASFPDWEQAIRQRMAPPPQSPYLLNLLREPGLFTEIVRDFLKLVKQFPDRYVK